MLFSRIHSPSGVNSDCDPLRMCTTPLALIV